MDDIIAWMTLSQLPGIGVRRFWSITRFFGEPAVVLASSKKDLRQIEELSGTQLSCFDQRDSVRKSCEKQLEKLNQMGGRCICYNDSSYPRKLKEISDPPPVLYVRGDLSVLQQPSIAMVGSRASTSYGNRIAFELAKDLAEAGVVITSGMALGIDSESHKGALAGHGKTAAVLGCGIDVIYPRQNRKLYEGIIANGTVVSEYPLATAPEAFRFPARNRIISGLSDGVVVIEAAKKSGSLITAQLALDEGREVYAVPGRVDSYKSEGTHWLLKQGAKLVQSKEDILEDLAMEPAQLRNHSQQGEGVQSVPSGLEPAARELLQHLDAYPINRNVLVQKCGLQISELSELLLLLELEGIIEIHPGDEISRVK